MVTYALVWFACTVIAFTYVIAWREAGIDRWDACFTIFLAFFWPLTLPLFIIAVFIDEFSSWVAKC